MTPYEILGVSENATPDEIRAAYLERARRYHPDTGGDVWAFQAVETAYASLRETFESRRTQENENAKPAPGEKTRVDEASPNGTAHLTSKENAIGAIAWLGIMVVFAILNSAGRGWSHFFFEAAYWLLAFGIGIAFAVVEYLRTTANSKVDKGHARRDFLCGASLVFGGAAAFLILVGMIMFRDYAVYPVSVGFVIILCMFSESLWPNRGSLASTATRNDATNNAPHTAAASEAPRNNAAPAGETSSTADPFRSPVTAAIIVLLLVGWFWQWEWRTLFVAGALGLAALATWRFVLVITAATKNRNRDLQTGIFAIAGFVLLLGTVVGAGIVSPGFPSLPVKVLKDTSLVILITSKERAEPQEVGQGSAFVYERKNDSLFLYTNSHCLNLGSIADRATVQRDKTANIMDYKVEIVFPSGKRKLVQKVAESGSELIDAAKLQVSAQGLVEGTDYLIVPAIENVLERLGVGVDDEVRAVGAPEGLDGTASRGWITSIRKLPPGASKVTLVQHSAPIDHGSSGGPLFLCRGKNAYCIGINTVGIGGGQTIGIAHSLDDIAKTDYVWADATPAGAAELIGKVHRIAAVPGDRNAPHVAFGPSTKPAPNKGDPFAGFANLKQPSIWETLWPFKSTFPFVRMPHGLILFALARHLALWIGRAPSGQAKTVRGE